MDQPTITHCSGPVTPELATLLDDLAAGLVPFRPPRVRSYDPDPDVDDDSPDDDAA